MAEIDGLAQPMGKLDGLASKKPRRRPRSGPTSRVACCEAASAAEYGGQRGVWGAAGPPEFF